MSGKQRTRTRVVEKTMYCTWLSRSPCPCPYSHARSPCKCVKARTEIVSRRSGRRSYPDSDVRKKSVKETGRRPPLDEDCNMATIRVHFNQSKAASFKYMVVN